MEPGSRPGQKGGSTQPGGASWSGGSGRWPEPHPRSDRADVLRLRALRALGDVELDLLVLVQGLVTLGLDGRVVHEDVVAAVLLGDEAEALLRVEPHNSALSHVLDTP